MHGTISLWFRVDFVLALARSSQHGLYVVAGRTRSEGLLTAGFHLVGCLPHLLRRPSKLLASWWNRVALRGYEFNQSLLYGWQVSKRQLRMGGGDKGCDMAYL